MLVGLGAVRQWARRLPIALYWAFDMVSMHSLVMACEGVIGEQDAGFVKLAGGILLGLGLVKPRDQARLRARCGYESEAKVSARVLSMAGVGKRRGCEAHTSAGRLVVCFS